MQELILDIRKSIKSHFEDLTFEEKAHKYYVSGKPIQKSVSTLIKDFASPFDENEISAKKAEREGINQEDLLKEWHDNRDTRIEIGKKTHLFGEVYTFNRNLRPSSNYELAVMKFWRDLPDFLIPVIVEQPMYHKEKLYAGTPDTILFNTKTGTLVITDYKTNVDLFKNFAKKRLLERFSRFLDNPFNKYQIQLSYYKILLEQTGYKVSSTKIIWLKEDASYEMFDTEDLTQYIK